MTAAAYPGGYLAMDRMRANVAGILRHCTPTDRRAPVAWAAGAYLAEHALSVVQLLTDRPCAGEHGCMSVYGQPYRDLNHHQKRGVWLTEGTRTLFRFTWADLAAPLKTLPAATVDGLRAALRERVARTDTFDPTRPIGWWQTPAGVEQNRRWGEIEDICYGLGAAAWAACRPSDEPADLLELLAAGGGM